MYLAVILQCICNCRAVTGCANWGSALPSPTSNATLSEFKWGHIRREIKHWILLLSSSCLCQRPCLPFSLPYSQAQPTEMFSGIKMFQNMLQEKKHSKTNQNNANLPLQAVGWTQGQSDSACGSTVPAVSVSPCMPSRGRRTLHSPHSQFWHCNSGRVEWDSNYFSAFISSRTH